MQYFKMLRKFGLSLHHWVSSTEPESDTLKSYVEVIHCTLPVALLTELVRGYPHDDGMALITNVDK